VGNENMTRHGSNPVLLAPGGTGNGIDFLLAQGAAELAIANGCWIKELRFPNRRRFFGGLETADP
jgi:hypothetical protein